MKETFRKLDCLGRESFIKPRLFFLIMLTIVSLVLHGCSVLSGSPPLDLVLDRPLEIDSSPQRVAVGSKHALFVKSDGTVWGMGSNFRHVLGQNSRGIAYNHPVQIKGLQDIVGVAAGHDFSVALDKSGQVWVWGSNKYGELGVDNVRESYQPIRVENLPTIKQVSVGSRYSLALASNGDVYAWGQNEVGQTDPSLKRKITIPHKVSELKNMELVVAGIKASFAINRDKEAFYWGTKIKWIGLPNKSMAKTSLKRVDELCPVVDIAPSGSLFICENGSVVGIGGNVSGELGLGDTKPRTELTLNPSLSGVINITGNNPLLALLANGDVVGWGDQAHGVAEYSNSRIVTNPILIRSPDDIASIYLRGSNAFLIGKDGEVYQWVEKEHRLVNNLYYFFEGYEVKRVLNEDGSYFMIKR